MRRRTFAKALGAGIAGLGFTSTVSARDEGELPNDHVEYTRVHPFALDESDPITVPAGNWVQHYIGWVDDGEQRRSDVQAFLDAVEYSAWIDGEEIENPDQYWGEIHQEYDEENDVYKWFVWWKYSTPPKEPGLHTYTSEFYFPDGLDAGDSQRDPGHRTRLKSYYEVAPRDGE